MLRDWAAAGQPIADFWDATPREFAAVVRGHGDRVAIMRESALAAAWVGALEARQKKMHKLDEVLGWFRPAKPQTPEQMIAAMRMVMAAARAADVINSGKDV